MEVHTPIEFKPGELRCPKCFSKDVAPSVERGWRDEVMRSWKRVPKECRFCGKRFYARIPSPAPES